MSFRIIITTFLIAQCASVQGLQCYECLDVGPDSPCLRNIVDVKQCVDTKYCMTKRIVDIAGELTSLTRYCSSYVSYINETTTSGEYTIHFTACTTDLCNTGDGSPEHWLGDLQCYSCLVSGEQNAQSDCALNPSQRKDFIKTCRISQDYCTITRSGLGDDSFFLERACSAEPEYINTTVTWTEGSQHIVNHYTACKERLCNSGSGFIDKDKTEEEDREETLPSNHSLYQAFNESSDGSSSPDKQSRTDLETFRTLLASFGPAFTSELQKGSQVLQCYDCQSEDEESDCVMDPARGPSSVVPCPHKYCSIRRKEKNGKFSSMRRLCEELPPYLNETASSGGSTVHYTSCTSHICNSGDGILEGAEENVLQCYDCQSEDEGSDCVVNPARDPSSVVTCPHQYCSIRRKEKNGKFSSLWRLCEELPPFMNESVSSSSSTVHYTSCTSDLCNRGNGVIEETHDKGLRCYSCSSIGAEEKGSACVTNPAELHDSLTRCSEGQEYCTITRGEIDGEFSALDRGCSERPERINATAVNVVKGRLSRTYHFSCKSDLCNDGDGFIKDKENESLWCYECESTNKDSLCVKNPAAYESFLSPCPFQYCSIRRAETTEGQFQSLWRMCEDEPLVINETVTSGSTKVHYTSCDTNICNDGEGNDGTVIAVPSTAVFAVCATVALHLGHWGN